MTRDDQMEFELDVDTHEPVTMAAVQYFLEFFDIPKDKYDCAMSAVSEMFRPLVDELEVVSQVVMEWCNCGK